MLEILEVELLLESGGVYHQRIYNYDSDCNRRFPNHVISPASRERERYPLPGVGIIIAVFQFEDCRFALLTACQLLHLSPFSGLTSECDE